ncbi:DoxX family protein [Nocardioides sp. NBC_00368]|uniref:DoxX family protein n=1 Tax=Nocardioides sp. NBC_00368 TaxID=2976000 RepID=UPI002E1CB9C8
MNPTTVLAATLAAVFVAFGTAKLLAVASMQTRAAHVGFSVGAFRRIGALEVAGAVGLLAGAYVPLLRAVAAIGLLLLLTGAVITHLRNGDGIKAAAPALFLAILLSILVVIEIRVWDDVVSGFLQDRLLTWAAPDC